jgi:hypothetical protein
MESDEVRQTEGNKIPLEVNYKIIMQYKFNPILLLLFEAAANFEIYTGI